MRKISLFMLYLLLSTSAGAVVDITKFKFKDFDLDLSAGYHQAFWTPYFGQELMEVDTEGLQSYNIGVGTSYLKNNLLFFQYERPFKTNPEQQSIIERNANANPGMEKLSFGLSPSVLIKIYKVKNPFLKMLLSTRYVNSKEIFFGKAKAKKAFAYVSKNSTVTDNGDGTVTFSSLERFSAGETLSFNTEFKDTSITMALPFELFSGIDIRFGYYKVKWFRPSDYDKTWITVSDSLQVVYDTKYESNGAEFTIESNDITSPGFNFIFNARWGVDNNVGNVVDQDFKLENNKDLYYASGILNLWYNWYLKGKVKDGLYATLGGSVSRRAFTTELSLFSGGVGAREDIGRVYGRIGYIF
ncbi:hypothetical protein A9Q84_14400 [Halobacteriovorax marinus]|uniref:Outer membrane protein beta-barrel domain-containing protein n=1 Tax=Halobacteriovorax marinus TaxID=97084 RepID=A0A1Y5F556_9BACT|nr:hypothetical protein A9Q84_14400 [Halobacteriovorax marinus]